MKELTVLSLFNGMSVGMIALKNLNVPIKSYYSSEIDKYAIKESQLNFPEIIQLGDITKWREWDIDWSSIDLLMGGSPCQGLSFAGKQKGLSDPRSKLFYTMIEIFEHIKLLNPKLKFLFENVKMKKESHDVFNELIGVDSICINSQNYTAHYRQRYYWVSTSNLIIPPPLNNSPNLQDIIESGYADRKKSYCIDANYYKGGDLNQYFNKSRRQVVFMSPFINKENLLNNAIKRVDYRHLSTVECCRLQGVPDDYFKVSSKTQQYKMLGNGWTVPVIEHLLREILF